MRPRHLSACKELYQIPAQRLCQLIDQRIDLARVILVVNACGQRGAFPNRGAHRRLKLKTQKMHGRRFLVVGAEVRGLEIRNPELVISAARRLVE